jgi:ParB family chromosome partitioning protein
MTTGHIADYPINEIRGAEYNPRRIDKDALQRLQVSLAALGCCKPIIVRHQTIVAGHQRTKALRAMGITTAPVYLLAAETNLADEVLFNQLHNGTDMDLGEEDAKVPVPPGTEGYYTVKPTDIVGNMRSSGASIRAEIMRLISKYGPWGACVAKPNGDIIHAAQYALACRATNLPLLVYVLREDQVEAAHTYLPAKYGEFCYDSLERNTFIQSFASRSGCGQASTTSGPTPTTTS